jgi:hypothetical protein
MTSYTVAWRRHRHCGSPGVSQTARACVYACCRLCTHWTLRLVCAASGGGGDAAASMEARRLACRSTLCFSCSRQTRQRRRLCSASCVSTVGRGLSTLQELSATIPRVCRRPRQRLRGAQWCGHVVWCRRRNSCFSPCRRPLQLQCVVVRVVKRLCRQSRWRQRWALRHRGATHFLVVVGS